MNPNHTVPLERPKRTSRLKQLSKSNRRMKKYYAEARRREVPVVN